jgi:pilus assembly protein Flp/PilA
MLELIRNLAKCQRGATAVEYGLILSLLVVVMIVALSNVASSTTGMWNVVSNKVVNVSPTQ